VIRDNGGEFCNETLQTWFKTMGIFHKKTTPYHPQSNARVECFHRDLKEILSKLVNNDSMEWYQQLPSALWSIRSSISGVTGYSPYFLLYGQEPRIPPSKLYQNSDQNLVNIFGNKLSDMANAMQFSRLNTLEARKYNRKILDINPQNNS
jgi:transposase InsO family protein